MSAPLDLRPVDRARRETELEAEQGLLGCILFDGMALRDVPHVQPHHFSEAVHGRVFTEILAIAAAGKAVSPLMVADRLRADEAFAALGGISLLGDMIDTAPPLTAARDLAEQVVEAWARRELTALASEAAKSAIEGKAASDMIATLKAAVMRLESEAAPEPKTFITARDAARAALDEIEMEVAVGRAKGAQTGLSCFDRRLGGLPPEWLIIIGGRPSMGKTALMRAGLYGAARQQPQKLFAIFSPEMGHREVSERALAATTADDPDPVTTERLNRSTVTPFDLQKLHENAEFIPDNLFIDDRSDLSVEDVRRAVWALKRRGDVAAIGIDYLQLMRRPDMRGRNEASVIGDMTQALKRLAREARICIVLLSQLSRKVEERDDKRPNLADLRESGSIEQDANAVLFPYREAYYLERNEPKETDAKHLEWEVALADVRRRMDVIVAKCRQGSIGTERQEYDPEYDRIQNWVRA